MARHRTRPCAPLLNSPLPFPTLSSNLHRPTRSHGLSMRCWAAPRSPLGRQGLPATPRLARTEHMRWPGSGCWRSGRIQRSTGERGSEGGCFSQRRSPRQEHTTCVCVRVRARARAPTQMGAQPAKSGGGDGAKRPTSSCWGVMGHHCGPQPSRACTCLPACLPARLGEIVRGAVHQSSHVAGRLALMQLSRTYRARVPWPPT